MKTALIVRELTESDIPLLADYWLLSDHEFLTGMGVDVQKLPSREAFTNMLANLLETPDQQKAAFAVIAEINQTPIGHCNLNPLVFGKEATMHLHLWEPQHRKMGLGTKMVKQSVRVFFSRLKIKTLWCEPYALNPAPNRTLTKLGFEFIKKYTTVPGSINFEQEVNQYRLTKENYLSSLEQHLQ